MAVGFTGMALRPTTPSWSTIARKLAYYNGFNPTGYLYTVDGATDDWAYGKFGIAVLYLRGGPDSGSCGDFFPAYGCIDGIDGMPRDFWAEKRPAFIFAHKIARTPYITAYGPDTQNLVVTPNSVPQGTPVASDGQRRRPSLRRRPARDRSPQPSTLSTLPARTAPASPCRPSTAPGVRRTKTSQATVDTSGLAPGQHYILVHGRNNRRQVGAVHRRLCEHDDRLYPGADRPGSLAARASRSSTARPR